MLSHREWFRLSIFSISLLINPISAADGAPKNADSLIHESGGKWTGQLPISTEASIPGNMPKGPEITPHYDQPSASKSGGSSGWGILGFFINLGKKSPKDQHMEDVRRNIDKALSKAGHGIPLTSEDYAATGTADLSKARQDPMWQVNFAKNTAPKATPKPVVSTPAPTMTVAPVTTPLPVNTYTSPSSNSITPHVGKGSITCLPQMTEFGVPGVVQPSAAIPTSNSPKIPNMPLGDKPNFPNIGSGKPPMIGAVIPPAPMKGPNGPSGGDIATGIGGTIAGAGAIIQVSAGAGATTAAGTAAGTTAAGGAVVTTGAGYGTWLLSTALPVAAGSIGLGLGVWAVLDYVYPDERNIFFKDRYQEKLKREANAKKNDGGGNQQNPKGPANSGAAAIAAQNTENARKVNTLQRTEVMKKLKENYRYDNQTKLYKLKDNGAPIKCSETGKKVKMVDWDGLHGDIEAYAGKNKHMGSLDPETLEFYKSGIKARKTN